MTGCGATAGQTDPFAATLPLLRALPFPALLCPPDGTIVAVSSELEDLLGETVETLSHEEFRSRCRVRFPTGTTLHWGDLCRDLKRERDPSVAVDLHDSRGRFHAMVATGALVRAGPEPFDVLVLFCEVTRMVESSTQHPRQPLSSDWYS